jgi:hypothetical protein
VLSDGDNTSAGGAGPGDPGGGQTVTDSTGAAQIGSPSVTAPTRIASDGDDADASVDVAAQRTPVESVDEPDSATLSQGEPVNVTETISDTTPAVGLADGGSSTGAELRTAALLGGGADSLPLTGLGLVAMLLTGLMLFAAGALGRRAGVAAG